MVRNEAISRKRQCRKGAFRQIPTARPNVDELSVHDKPTRRT